MEFSSEMTHQLTHQTIHCRFLFMRIDKKIKIDQYNWISAIEAGKYAFPRLITRYLEARIDKSANEKKLI